MAVEPTFVAVVLRVRRHIDYCTACSAACPCG
jgi:hypothetical protein